MNHHGHSYFKMPKQVKGRIDYLSVRIESFREQLDHFDRKLEHRECDPTQNRYIKLFYIFMGFIPNSVFRKTGTLLDMHDIIHRALRENRQTRFISNSV